jgi:hypothetical protein
VSEQGSPEMDLVVACCRWPPSPDRDAAVRQAAARTIDWDRVEQVTARHRVVGLVRDGLQRAGVSAPADNDCRLADAARNAAHLALAMARESLRLQAALDAAGVPALFVKGSTVAILAFGQLGIKQSWDIDLVTTPAQAANARLVLERLGYVVAVPGAVTAQAFERIVEFGKEAEFHHPVSGIWVELHWRLVDNESLLRGIDPFGASQSVSVAGAALRTLDRGGLFAYLCVHGTMHGWSRLKWLADVAALIASYDESEIIRLYDAAVALGAGRAPAVTLRLCETLWHLPVPAALRRRWDGDWIAAALAANALSCLTYGGGTTEISAYSLPGVRILLSQFFIGGTAASVGSEMRRKWNSEQDRRSLPLPDRLSFLYHLLRVPLWLSRLSTRVVSRWVR